MNLSVTFQQSITAPVVISRTDTKSKNPRLHLMGPGGFPLCWRKVGRRGSQFQQDLTGECNCRICQKKATA